MNKLIYISSTWCQPCKTFSPIMDKVSSSGIPVQKLDADKDQNALMQYGVRSIPTVVKVDANGNMVDKFTGVKQFQEIINFYNN